MIYTTSTTVSSPSKLFDSIYFSLRTKMDISEKSDAIIEYLMGDWMIEELEGIIQSNFPEYDTNKVQIVAQNAADFYCSNNNQNGYEIEDFEEILLGKKFEIDESLL